MSWLFSRALVAASLGDISLDGKQSARSRKMQGEPEFWLLGKTTDFFHPSRFGRTWRPLTASLGAALLMWCQAEAPVKGSALRAVGSDWMTQEANSSSRCCALPMAYDLDLCSWRTLQSSGERVLPWSSVNLPISGMLVGGMCFRLPEWARSTSGNDSSCLPTLQKSDATRGDCPSQRRRRSPGLVTLSGQGLLPTLTKHDRSPAGKGCRERGGGRGCLASMARDGQLMPTLCKRDYRAPNSPDGMSRRARAMKNCGKQLPNFLGGPLHPTWCEWFMGFPEGWSELKVLETRKFRAWCRQHGSISHKD